MKTNWSERLRVAIGAVLLAVALFALMAAPGLVSGQDSTAALRSVREAGR